MNYMFYPHQNFTSQLSKSSQNISPYFEVTIYPHLGACLVDRF
ncbi:hypothetical protein [Campylobacter concisus]|nr:hypothetical protein [Campylobacter concisus]